VTVRGLPATRPTTLVAPEARIAVDDRGDRYASRGGDKLDSALRRLPIAVEGRRWLDAGSSTGGFTDRLLRGGARAVAAVDVGYGQLAWHLRRDPRVVVLERTNARRLAPTDLPWSPDGIVADLSFISLRLVLPALAAIARPDADLLPLVKPQFEVGRARVPKGGVVRDPSLWREALVAVAEAAEGLGLAVVDALPAEPPGPAGNREFFLHLRRDARPGRPEAIERAIAEAAR
jgi:23S rRNA (cytidine1920-2'-O)/16S rRNA (cytidine1409-2'-O)-methyltransferase